MLSENSAMHVLVVILLTVSIFPFVRAGRQLFLIKNPAKEDDASSKDIFIRTENGPKYLVQKSFKIVPVSSTATNRRTSRKNDQPGWTLPIPKHLEQGLSRRVHEILLKQDTKIASTPAYQQALKRNENINLPDVGSVQNINYSDGMIAVPVSTPQKGKVVSQVRLNNEDIHVNINADKNKLSRSDQGGKQSESLKKKQVIAIQPEPSSVKELTGWVYPKNNPLVSVETSNPEPYDFGYGINDGLGSTQFPRESTDGDGVITGNYGYKDYKGVFRHVNYVADKDGFRAVMRSNEPSVLPVDSADVTVIVDPPPSFFIPSKS